MWLLPYVNLNKLRFHLLHNSWLSAIKDHCFYRVIEIWITQKKKKKKKKSKCNEVWLWDDIEKKLT
jgi:hypothetical protein